MSHFIHKDKLFEFKKNSKIPYYNNCLVTSVEYNYLENTVTIIYKSNINKKDIIEIKLEKSNFRNNGEIVNVKYDYKNLDPLKITIYLDNEGVKKSSYEYIYPKEKDDIEKAPSPKRTYDDIKFNQFKNNRKKKKIKDVKQMVYIFLRDKEEIKNLVKKKTLLLKNKI